MLEKFIRGPGKGETEWDIVGLTDPISVLNKASESSSKAVKE